MRGIIEQILSVAFLVGIVGNLVASAIWAIPALIHIHRKLDRHHRRLLDEIRLGNSAIDPNVSAPNSDNSPSLADSGKVD